MADFSSEFLLTKIFPPILPHLLLPNLSQLIPPTLP